MAYFITPENAAELQRKKTAMHYAKTAAVRITANESEQAEEFRIQRLARVRIQLVRLDKLLSDECDPQKLDRLMSALNRLQEAEGWLAGRAKPKPSITTKQKPRSGSQSAPEPQDDPPPTS